jgi:hypothetical protein
MPAETVKDAEEACAAVDEVLLAGAATVTVVVEVEVDLKHKNTTADMRTSTTKTGAAVKHTLRWPVWHR